MCDSIAIASLESPGDISLCTKHYQQVYRMLNAKSDVRVQILWCVKLKQ